MPVTTPLTLPTVATAVLLLVQTPTPALNKVVVLPTHTDVIPVIGAGKGLTNSVVVAMQLVLKVYVIIAVPALTPDATPLKEPIVATAMLLLLHVPPIVASLSVVVLPTQTAVTPVIAAGSGLTVIIVVVRQPVPNV